MPLDRYYTAATAILSVSEALNRGLAHTAWPRLHQSPVPNRRGVARALACKPAVRSAPVHCPENYIHWSLYSICACRLVWSPRPMRHPHCPADHTLCWLRSIDVRQLVWSARPGYTASLSYSCRGSSAFFSSFFEPVWRSSPSHPERYPYRWRKHPERCPCRWRRRPAWCPGYLVRSLRCLVRCPGSFPAWLICLLTHQTACVPDPDPSASLFALVSDGPSAFLPDLVSDRHTTFLFDPASGDFAAALVAAPDLLLTLPAPTLSLAECYFALLPHQVAAWCSAHFHKVAV